MLILQGGEQPGVAPHLDRHGEPVGVKLQEAGKANGKVVIRVQEHDPDVIVYDIQGDLALADGAVDEGHDDVVGAVQKEHVP